MARKLFVLIAILSAVVFAACAAPPTPTPVPPTAVPPTAVPATKAPVATAVPPTSAPTTVPATTAPTTAPTVAPTAVPATKAPVSTGPVRLIGNGALDFSSIDVAYWEQSLKKMGMTVDFKWVDSPDTALRTIIAGAADAYVGSLPSAILAVKNANANVRIIAVNNQATDYVLLSKLEINSIEDLKGKTIGISTPGSAADTIIRTALKQKGFDPASARFVTIGGTSARLTALLAGQIDAAPVHAAEGGNAVTTGKAKVIMSAGESIGVYLQSGMIASGDWIKKDPQAVQQVVDAFIDASRWAGSNKDGYIALSKNLLPKLVDAERVSAYDLYIKAKFWPVNGGLGQEGVDRLLKLEQESGGLPKDLPAQAQWLDDTFVKNYIKTHAVMPGN
ncbi:MAG: ABC transporter substrate-binding protein [Chloroflexi bacterium]|nr:ABC transporter substrate-binding protein [Chloroflexota bacterium]